MCEQSLCVSRVAAGPRLLKMIIHQSVQLTDQAIEQLEPMIDPITNHKFHQVPEQK